MKIIASVCACAAFTIASGCRSTTAVEAVAGRLPLMSYNGASIPATIDHIPSTGLDGSTSRCDVLVTTGILELRRDATYSLKVEHRNSCTMMLLAIDTDSGTFLVAGDSMSLRVQGSAPPLWGRIGATLITIHEPPAVSLEFKR